MPAASRDPRRRNATLLIALAAGALASCGDDSFGPTVDCDLVVGQLFIELTPEPLGVWLDYEVDVGDSLQVRGTVHRVDEAAPRFDVQRGWYCTGTASTLVPGTVTLATEDTELVRLAPGGWIQGLQPGTARITASSAAPAASRDIYVLVYLP